jgi:YibE/F-like protein
VRTEPPDDYGSSPYGHQPYGQPNPRVHGQSRQPADVPSWGGEYPTQRLRPAGDYRAARQDQGEYGRPDPAPGGREIRSHAASSRSHRRDRDRPGRDDGYGHGHDDSFEVSQRTVSIVRWILIPCAILTAVLIVVLWPGRPEIATAGNSAQQRAYGEVLQVTEVPCPDGAPTHGPPLPCGTALVRISSGPGSGQDWTVNLPQGPGAPQVAEGDEVVLSYVASPTVDGPPQTSLIDKQRGSDLLVMLGLCALAVIAFGRLRGVTALIGLGMSFAFLLLFIIPAILNGQAPLPVAIVGSAAIMFAVLYLTHGVSVTTSVAVLGTLVSLVVTGLLGALFTATTSLTGFGDDNAIYVSILNSEVDVRARPMRSPAWIVR